MCIRDSHRHNAPLPVETQVVSIERPNTLAFFLFPFFFVFPFPFVVPRLSLPFRFVCSFCRFLFISCITFFALFPPFPALLGGGFCFFFVSVLHPPSTACEPASLRIPLVCCLLSFLAFLRSWFKKKKKILPCFSISSWTSFVSSCLVLVVILYCVSSVFGFCCVCVLHIEPVFLPVDIQHTQCPCWFFLLERCKQALWSQNHDTEIPHCTAVTMQWPAIVLDTTGATYERK